MPSDLLLPVVSIVPGRCQRGNRRIDNQRDGCASSGMLNLPAAGRDKCSWKVLGDDNGLTSTMRRLYVKRLMCNGGILFQAVLMPCRAFNYIFMNPAQCVLLADGTMTTFTRISTGSIGDI